MVRVLSWAHGQARQDRAARCATGARDLVGPSRARRGPVRDARAPKDTHRERLAVHSLTRRIARAAQSAALATLDRPQRPALNRLDRSRAAEGAGDLRMSEPRSQASAVTGRVPSGLGRRAQAMTFDAYDRSLSLIRQLVPLLERLVTIDPKLADQLRRAAQNVALNCQEANRRRGRDRRNRFLWCLAEAAEVTGALEVAIAFGYLSAAQCVEALVTADRVRAMMYRLSH
jgi:four helix bundle protein